MSAEVKNSSILFSTEFDCVVMLTWSNWSTEMRSNRFHYAARLRHLKPVIFVQPDLPSTDRYALEPTELDSVTILHVSNVFNDSQSRSLATALSDLGFRRPCFWIYNVLFVDAVEQIYSPFRAFHATEDYFSESFSTSNTIRTCLSRLLKSCDLVIAVSEGVASNIVRTGNYTKEVITAKNGVDFTEWGNIPHSHDSNNWIALYQGGISRKLDWQLLNALAISMPDWNFHFCGEVFDVGEEWRELLRRPNVKYLGKLDIDSLKKATSIATVGLIPFKRNDWITQRSLPLKTFEYLAAGLPVVSVPIESIIDTEGLIAFASSPQDFSKAIRQASDKRESSSFRLAARDRARREDYDLKFDAVIAKINSILEARALPSSNLNKPRIAIVVSESFIGSSDFLKFLEGCRLNESIDWELVYSFPNQAIQPWLDCFHAVILIEPDSLPRPYFNTLTKNYLGPIFCVGPAPKQSHRAIRTPSIREFQIREIPINADPFNYVIAQCRGHLNAHKNTCSVEMRRSLYITANSELRYCVSSRIPAVQHANWLKALQYDFAFEAGRLDLAPATALLNALAGKLVHLIRFRLSTGINMIIRSPRLIYHLLPESIKSYARPYVRRLQSRIRQSNKR